jgi:predicted nucleic acid-binding protein
VDAFDSDVLIYAAAPGHPLGRRVRALLPQGDVGEDDLAGIGSVLLLSELLAKPMRRDNAKELESLAALLARIDLRPADIATAQLATELAASYGLHAADAVHLATAVAAGADRFITNNRSDFPKTITEIDVIYPDELPDS